MSDFQLGPLEAYHRLPDPSLERVPLPVTLRPQLVGSVYRIEWRAKIAVGLMAEQSGSLLAMLEALRDIAKLADETHLGLAFDLKIRRAEAWIMKNYADIFSKGDYANHAVCRMK